MANSPMSKKLISQACSVTSFQKLFLGIAFLLITNAGFAQPACNISPTTNCDPIGSGSVFLMSSATNVDMTFDTFGKYLSGITVNGASLLRLVVTEAVAPCRWQLHVNIDNGGIAPITEWEPLVAYGAVGPPHPTVDLLQVRVRNACNTSLSGNNFVTVPNINTAIDIVDSPGISNASGGCAGINVNSPGSYLTNYGEYSFVLDYRVIPTFAFRPGIYQLTVRYCLTEDI